MLSFALQDSEILQLKQIVNGAQNEEMQLKLVKEFEVSKSLKTFDILSKLSELLPLATSTLAIEEIISIFARRFVTLLDDLSILESAELSHNALKYLKNFWSLCSSQQSVISSSQLFGKWDPSLLEAITALASIIIDLFIAAYGHKENQFVFSKKLYSWLAFDLPDRAIKIALLEVTGHSKDGSEIAGGLLSNILKRKFDDNSNEDYLLHFLLLKKWQSLAAVSDLMQTAKSLKAPPSFVGWLKSLWSEASDYIPDDKSLTGMVVSHFLLDLDANDVLEPLTDVLQMAVFPENIENGAANGEISDLDNILFTIDKKGLGQEQDNTKKHLNKDSSKLMVKSGRKRTASETLDSPKKKRGMMEMIDDADTLSGEEVPSSPRKKKQKTKTDKTVNEDDVLGFTVDRGLTKSSNVNTVVKVNDDVEEEKETSDQSDSEVTELSSEDKVSENGDDGDSSDVVAVESAENRKKNNFGSENLAAAVLKSKNILISDPVTSSYFDHSSGKEQGKGNVIQIFGFSEEGENDSIREEIVSKSPTKKNSENPLKEKESPLKQIGNESPQKFKEIQSPRKQKKIKSPKQVDSVQQISQSIESFHGKPDCVSTIAIEDGDENVKKCKETMETNFMTSKTIITNYVTIDNNDSEVGRRSAALTGINMKGKKSVEHDISLKLSELRKSTISTPSKKGGSTTPQTKIETPTRRSTRVRNHLENNSETTPSKKSNVSSSSLLKHWLKTSTTNSEITYTSEADIDVQDIQKSSPTKRSMTKIKDRQLSESKYIADDAEDGDEAKNLKDIQSPSNSKTETSLMDWLGGSNKKKELTKSDVFPSPSLKTYSMKKRTQSGEKLKKEAEPEAAKEDEMPDVEPKAQNTPSRTKSTNMTPKSARNQSKDVGDKSPRFSPAARRKSLRSAKH